MPFEKYTYADRLPYGLAYNRDTAVEILFDRGYCAIAIRNTATPQKVHVLEKRAYYPKHDEQYFALEHGRSQKAKLSNLAFREMILARFICGVDVSMHLKKPLSDYSPKAAYLSIEPGPRKQRALKGQLAETDWVEDPS